MTSSDSSDTPKPVILHLDDTDSSVELVATLMGVEYVRCTRPAEALERLDSITPEVIVTDLLFKGGDVEPFKEFLTRCRDEGHQTIIFTGATTETMPEDMPGFSIIKKTSAGSSRKLESAINEALAKTLIADKGDLSILIMDDEEAVLRARESTISSAGFKTLPCRSLEQAKHAAERRNPDIVICDLVTGGDTLDVVKFLIEQAEAGKGAILHTGAEYDSEVTDVPGITVVHKPDMHGGILAGMWTAYKKAEIVREQMKPMILHVDDYEPSHRTMPELLGRQGFRVVSCDSPSEAQELLRTEKVDLVLTDILFKDKYDRYSSDEEVGAFFRNCHNRGLRVLVHTNSVWNSGTPKHFEGFDVIAKGKRSPALASEIQKALAKPKPRQKTVLIVDDNAVLLDHAKTFFENERGYRVLTADNPVQGLMHLATKNIDVVVSDVLFKDQGNFEYFVQTAAFRALPVVFWTGATYQKDPKLPHLEAKIVPKSPNKHMIEAVDDFLAEQSEPRKTILYVEDGGIQRDDFSLTLVLNGYSVIPSMLPAHALRTLNSEIHVDLVLSDILFCPMDGFEDFVRTCGDQGLPFIFWSGAHMDVPEIPNCEFLDRLVGSKKVLATIAQMLGHQGKPHVLFVEDDRQLASRYADSRVLGRHFRTTVCSCPEEAEVLMGEQSFDAIVTDVKFDGTPGFMIEGFFGKLSRGDTPWMVLSGALLDKKQYPGIPILLSPVSYDNIIGALNRILDKRPKVLFVDDDIPEQVVDGFSQAGKLRMTLCRSPVEALKALETQKFDLVVSDVMFPDADVETVERFLKNTINSCTPVLLVTDADADKMPFVDGLRILRKATPGPGFDRMITAMHEAIEESKAKKTILFVDDRLRFSSITIDELRDAGHHVITCHSPQIAMEILDQRKVHAVVSDVLFEDEPPKCTGDLVRRSQELEIPTFLWTNASYDEQSEFPNVRCIDKGSHTTEILVDEVTEALEQAREPEKPQPRATDEQIHMLTNPEWHVATPTEKYERILFYRIIQGEELHDEYTLRQEVKELRRRLDLSAKQGNWPLRELNETMDKYLLTLAKLKHLRDGFKMERVSEIRKREKLKRK